jgi:hypothetical protein
MEHDADWLVSLLGACDRGLERLRAEEASPLSLIRDIDQLRRDIEDLRADVLARLEALELHPWAEGERNHILRIVPVTITGRRVGRAP